MSRARRRVARAPRTFADRAGDVADRLIGVFSPEVGMRRQQLRAAEREFRFGYGRSATDRTRGGWYSVQGSADAEILPDLPSVRGRSRELIANDPIAASIKQTLVDNVVGTGIRAQSNPDRRVLGVSDATIEAVREAAEERWQTWTCEAEFTGRHDLHSMMRLGVGQWVECGEVFLVRNVVRESVTREFWTCWDVIDPDRVSSPDDTDRLDTRNGKNQIRSGVELTSRGVPVAYHIRLGHPGDGIYETSRQERWRRISAFDPVGRPNVIHLYQQQRPGQTRGLPVLAPVMGSLDHLARFQEAALIRERVAACFSAFIVKPEHSVGLPFEGDGGATQRAIDLEPGQVEQLLPGEDIRFPNLGGLGQDFEKFVRHTMRQVGAALGLPLELFAKDFSQTNYSSARGAVLEARRVFQQMQRLLIRRVLQPMWDLLFEEAFLRGDLGRLPGASENLRPWSRASWVPPGYGWVDPQKEIAASKAAIEVGVSTLADEAAAQGRDWEEVLEQQAREKQKRTDLGLTAAPIPTQENEPPPQESDQEETDDDAM